MRIEDIFKKHSDDGAEWISMSDMMTGLMVIFLLLFVISTFTISSMETDSKNNETDFIKLKKNRGLLVNKLNALEKQRSALKLENEKLKFDNQSLERLSRDSMNAVSAGVFKKRDGLINDLKQIWNESKKQEYGFEVTDNGGILFTKGLFNKGSDVVLPELRRSLEFLLPDLANYIKKNSEVIQKVEIVGHASNDWDPCYPVSSGKKDAQNLALNKYSNNLKLCKYYENMVLSQDRSFSVLKASDEILNTNSIIAVINNRSDIVSKYFFANARSSSDEIEINNTISLEKSRRAELNIHFDYEAMLKLVSKEYNFKVNIDSIYPEINSVEENNYIDKESKYIETNTKKFNYWGWSED